MYQFLQPADGPVVDGLEEHEIVMAERQPEYNPLRCLPGLSKEGERLSRWTLTPEQREAVANGADIFIELWTFNRGLQPMRVAVSDGPTAEIFYEAYNLKLAGATAAAKQ